MWPSVEIIAESQYRFVIPRQGRKRVPGVVFASQAPIPDPAADHALEQVVNVAELPATVAAADGGAFASACHGAGRRMSRHQAARSITGPELRRAAGTPGHRRTRTPARGLAEETPQAYKDIIQVVQAAEGAGLCRKVARLAPLGVIKG